MVKRKVSRGGAIATSMGPMGVPSIMAPSKESTSTLSEEKALHLATKVSLVILVDALQRLSKEGEKAKFSEDEQKYIGRALGWLYLTTAGTEYDPIVDLHKSDKKVVKDYKEKFFKKAIGGGRGRMYGGVPIAALIMGIVSVLMGVFTTNELLVLDANRDLIRAEGLAAIQSACPQYVVQGIKPVVQPGWFGRIDQNELRLLRDFEQQDAYCNNVKTAVAGRINDAEMAYATAWKNVPAVIASTGSTAAVAMGTGVGVPAAIASVATTILTGNMLQGRELETAVTALNGIGYPAAAGAGPPPATTPQWTGTSTTSSIITSPASREGPAPPPAPSGTSSRWPPESRKRGGRKTKKVKKSKRRVTLRTIKFAY